MESDSQPASTIDQPPNRFADILGTLIALLTLILPLVMISHYSGSSEMTPTPYQLSKSR